MARVQERWLAAAAGWGLVVCLSGCVTPPTDRQVQQGAAKTTVAVKEGTKQAVVEARAAAADAGHQLRNVASGVKEGLQEDSPRIDLNTASQVRLATLPGVSFAKAGAIVDKRPYTSSRQLVSRGLLTSKQYARIASSVTTSK